MPEQEKRILGGRPRTDDVCFLSMFNLTPWQQEKLLPAVVGLLPQSFMGHVIYAVEVNRAEMEAVNRIAEAENIHVLRQGDLPPKK